jgi:hypothetical protein
MSFSFSAAGTKEETLASIAKAEVNGNTVGESVKAFLTSLVEDDATKPDDTHDVKYTVTASGHSDGGVGSGCYANIAFSTGFKPKPVPSA